MILAIIIMAVIMADKDIREMVRWSNIDQFEVSEVELVVNNRIVGEVVAISIHICHHVWCLLEMWGIISSVAIVRFIFSIG